MRWLIAVPVWGAGSTYIHSWLRVALPSVRQAISAAGIDATFLLHTDVPDQMRQAMAGLDVICMPVPHAPKPHARLGLAHREALTAAAPGQPVVIWCADMVMSSECVSAALRRFESGKLLIMMAATRTHGAEPPIGARSRDLLRWSMDYPHPITIECFWGTGRCSVPWAVYFRNGDDIVLRAFHLHPFAIIKQPNVNFSGLTVDFGLAAAYTREETHVVTDADEMAAAEMSPITRRIKNSIEPMSAASVAAWAKRNTISVHRRFFRDCPITITGRGQCEEQTIVDDIIARIE